MKIYIPNQIILPDDITGEIPKYPVSGTEDTSWFDVLQFWTSLGYLISSATDLEMILSFTSDPAFVEKNSYMRAVWQKQLCNTDNQVRGEVEGWSAVWIVNPSVYAEEMSHLIPNVAYPDPEPVQAGDNPTEPGTLYRKWNQWGSPSHTHYYAENWQFEDKSLVDKYLVPTWSWGSDILGTEINYGYKTVGVNLFDKNVFQKCLSQEGCVPVAIEPTITG